MRILTIILLNCFVCFTGCKNTEKDQFAEAGEQPPKNILTEQDIAQLKYTDYILDQKAQEIIKDSNEYLQLQDLKDQIRKGDLKFFEIYKDGPKDLFKNLRKTWPDELNSESILARILVLETKFLQLESLLKLSTTDKDQILEASKEFLVAFSNLNLQINKKMELDNRVIEKP